MLHLRLVETIPGSLSDNNHINSCLIKLYTILYSYLYETNTFKLIVLNIFNINFIIKAVNVNFLFSFLSHLCANLP